MISSKGKTNDTFTADSCTVHCRPLSSASSSWLSVHVTTQLARTPPFKMSNTPVKEICDVVTKPSCDWKFEQGGFVFQCVDNEK